MYSCIYQIKNDKYNYNKGNSISNNYESTNSSYKESLFDKKRKSISL